MTQFNESQHNRATDGKFTHKPHAEADPIRLHPAKEEYELRAIHDARKSFHGKATVTRSGGEASLHSYGTKVVTIKGATQEDPNNMFASPDKVTLHPRWDKSPTTVRHVKEFLTQQGFVGGTTKQIREQYADTED